MWYMVPSVDEVHWMESGGDVFVGVCRLGGSVRPLRRSHILPEFGYEHLYDPRHRFYRLGGVDGVHYMRKGHRERLLCDACEGRLNPHETYTSAMLRTLPVPPRDQVMVRWVDYAPFKLFQLSLLWRMHISSDPLFQKVDIGAVHAERLRTMLLTEDTGPATAYPSAFFAVTYKGRQRADFINVWHHRRAGHHEYGLFFAGFVWGFVVSNHMNRHPIAEITLREDGRLAIGSFEMDGSDGLRRYASKLVDANRPGVERLHARDRSKRRLLD